MAPVQNLEERITYRASRWGQIYHNLPHNEALGAGSAGPGKTLVLIMEPFQQIQIEHKRMMEAIDHPFPLQRGASLGWALHLRRTYKELKQTISRTKKIFPQIDPGCRWIEESSELDMGWLFSSGFKYQFGHCKDPDDWEMYQSSEFCVAKGTRVSMGDGSLRAIEDVRMGDMVLTLEGPKRVRATHRPGAKPCVLAQIVDAAGRVVASQIHPENHPVLTSDGWRSSPSQHTPYASQPKCEWLREGLGAAWQSYTGLRRADQETRERRGSPRLQARGIDFESSGCVRQESLLPDSTSLVAALHAPTLLSAALGTERESLARELFHGHCGWTESQDSQAGCRRADHSGGERFQDHSGIGQPSSLQPADAAARSLASCTLDDQEPSLEHNRAGRCRYAHPYTMEEREGSAFFLNLTCTMSPVGEHEVFDLTVEDCNHYITEAGFVNRNSIICFDELVQFNQEQYDQIRSRLRSSDPVTGDPARRLLKIRSMSNPLMRRTKDDNYSVHDPHWVRRRFVEPAIRGNVTLERELIRGDGRVEIVTSIYVPARLSDNPNKAFVDSYEINLLSLPPHIRKAQLDGDWFVTVGSYYVQWDPNIHTCRPFRVPHDWPIWRSMDWGFKKPGCVHWWAMDEDGNMFCIRELTFSGKLVHEVAAEMEKIERAMGVWKGKRSTLTGPADSQLWERRGDSAQSKADMFRECGIIWTVADKRSRQNNAERLQHRLQDHAGGTTTPGFVVFDTCTDLIKTLPSIQASSSNPEEPEDGGEDHWTDSAVYSCAYASHGRAGIAGGPKDEDDEFDDEPVTKSRGAHGYGSALA